MTTYGLEDTTMTTTDHGHLILDSTTNLDHTASTAHGTAIESKTQYATPISRVYGFSFFLFVFASVFAEARKRSYSISYKVKEFSEFSIS